MFNNIRLAEGRDIPYLLQLTSDAHKVSPYKNSVFDPLVVLDLFKRLIDGDKKKEIILVATDDLDKPIGLLMATISNVVFNNEPVANEILWWVEPNFRKSKSGIALYKAFEFWSDQLGCKQKIMSTTDKRLIKFYKRQGYNIEETMFIKGI